MPWTNRPTLAQLRARIKTDLQGELENSAAFYGKSFERGVANALAGASHHQHDHLDWLAEQMDPRKCSVDLLESLHGAPWGIYPVAAGEATLVATSTGTNGVDVPQGTVYTREDGTRYAVDALETVAGGVVTLSLTAEIAGSSANVDDGAKLTISSPIPGLSAEATVSSTSILGYDEEDIDTTYRERLIVERQTRARGGAKNDFLRWVAEVAGTTRRWEFPKLLGAGTMVVYAVNDDDNPITLTTEKLDEIAAHLDQAGKQPAIATVYVRTPFLQEVNPEIHISPNTQAVRDAVEAELKSMLARDAHPGGYTLALSKIREAISIAPGEEKHVLVSPTADIVHPVGFLPIVGTITWGTL